jgi:hypothetical protein
MKKPSLKRLRFNLRWKYEDWLKKHGYKHRIQKIDGLEEAIGRIEE